MPIILALLVVQIIYASGVIVGKFMLPVVPAPVIVTMRMIVATIAFFLAHRGDARGEQEFHRRFDLMALQRNLKALGTFGYMTTSRNNTVYIQYIPRTLRHARENLHRHARFARLADLLAVHVAEFR